MVHCSLVAYENQPPGFAEETGVKCEHPLSRVSPSHSEAGLIAGRCWDGVYGLYTRDKADYPLGATYRWKSNSHIGQTIDSQSMIKIDQARYISDLYI